MYHIGIEFCILFCISNLGKIIQIVSYHVSDSDQSTESVQPEKERGHGEPPQEQSSTESGRAVQLEKEGPQRIGTGAEQHRVWPSCTARDRS